MISKELRCSFPEAGHLFYGEDDRSGDRDNDKIEFFTVRPPLEPERGREARILKVSYYLDQARGGRGYVLKREEQIVTGTIPTEQQMTLKGKKERLIKMEDPWRCVLAANVRGLNFEYSWGDEWVPFCEKGFGLPAGVRVALTLKGEDKRAETRRFDTAVRMTLEHGKGPPKEKRR